MSGSVIGSAVLCVDGCGVQMVGRSGAILNGAVEGRSWVWDGTVHGLCIECMLLGGDSHSRICGAAGISSYVDGCGGVGEGVFSDIIVSAWCHFQGKGSVQDDRWYGCVQ